MTRDQRGLTLVEVTIALVMASLVMVGLIGFYVSSQTTWLDSSSKAVTQREGTLALEEITKRARSAAAAIPVTSPDADHMQLLLYDNGGNVSWRFWWEPADSLIHQGPEAGDVGPLINARATRFQVDVTGGSLVEIRALHLLSPTGEAIHLSSAAALYNRP